MTHQSNFELRLLAPSSMLSISPNMVSSIEPPVPLKGKLTQVKTLLDEADKRLKEQATKYEVFATRSSATPAACSGQTVPTDLMKTIGDIGTLKSILSCPIFNKIVNVTDSLDKLSYHLNLHPSIGPSDINLDNNGELILAPCMDPSSINNLINSQIDGFSDHSNISPNFISPIRSMQPLMAEQDQQIELQLNMNGDGCSNVSYLVGQYENNSSSSQRAVVANPETLTNHQKNFGFGTEKLVSNSNIKNARSRDQYETSGQIALKRLDCLDQNDQENGYRTTKIMPMTNSKDGLRSPNQIDETDSLRKKVHRSSPPTNGKSRTIVSPISRPNLYSCSPSNSVGSTVRMADECDSGASSYQSQNAKSTPSSSLPYKSIEPVGEAKEVAGQEPIEEVAAPDEEVVDDLSPDMERIEVTLQKDADGLGINVAGYTCEEGEVSGIFIKHITPGSAADRCGKLRLLDQILTVDGREILDCTNAEAISLLKRTGRAVTLELMRCVSETKFKRLLDALSKASRDNTPVVTNQAELMHSSENHATKQGSLTKSSRQQAHLDNTKTTGLYQAKPTYVQVSGHLEEPATVEESSYKDQLVSRFLKGNQESTEPTPKVEHFDISLTNDSYMSNLSPDLKNRIPIAAQRVATNKVIETKQGARNTIDIRSPLCQTDTPTYVNRVADLQLEGHNRNLRAWHDFGRLGPTEKPEWERETNIVELHKDGAHSLGFTVKDYENPEDRNQSIFMVTSITPGGVADQDERLEVGDLLIFVDDTNLEGATPAEMVKALKRANGQVRLGILKLKRY